MKKNTAFRHLAAGIPLVAVLLCLNCLTAAPAAEPKPPQASTAPAGLSLFDGKTLRGWKVADFAGTGEVSVTNNQIILGQGVMTGVVYTNTDIPKIDYEVRFEAQRVEGSDFFCALTFPVKEDACTLVVGGWGGGLVGLSCLDGEDAANNETTTFMAFTNKVWYDVRMRVTSTNLQAWINDERLVSVGTKDRKISIRWECEPCKPFGLATWSTTGAIRKIRVHRLGEK